MNEKVKLCLFASYFANFTSDYFAPFGYDNVQGGLWSVKIKDLALNLDVGIIYLFNPNNGKVLIHFDRTTECWFVWVDAVDGNSIKIKFDIDYWLDKMKDGVV